MKTVTIENLRISPLKSVYLNSKFEDVICPKFIKFFFGFKELPETLDELIVVKNKKGFIKLNTASIQRPYSMYWSSGDIVSDKAIKFKGTSFGFDHSLYETLSSELIELFDEEEKEIRVDVYIRGYQWRILSLQSGYF